MNTVVLVAAIAWVGWVLIATRRRLRSGRIVVPPLFVATLVFSLGIVAVMAFGTSPLHLLWWFPLSFVLGLVALMFPASLHFTMACLALLTGLNPDQPSSRKRR